MNGLAADLSVVRSITQRTPFLWLNQQWRPLVAGSAGAKQNTLDIGSARNKWRQFSGLLELLFPELEIVGGTIESPLLPAVRIRAAMVGDVADYGRWLIKADHALPIAGSIKARGGIYGILLHAEDLAQQHGLINELSDRRTLASSDARRLFKAHEVSVGSTGNLGLSIGLTAAALGFHTIVHMSSDAKAWKKKRLRDHGVEVIEHCGDFGVAVEAGRSQALQRSNAYFVDDENSSALFFGYSTAICHLQDQLASQNVKVDETHPLFVYLPCGVGGAPGGITFALRHLLGDHVHCFFAEPVASPSMLIRLASQSNAPVSVREYGLDNLTEADGLAVARASEFVVPLIRHLVSGVFTIPDDHLFEDLYLLQESEGLKIEPSAAAGFRGPRWVVSSEAGNRYLLQHVLDTHIQNATHILWTTGGAFVPVEEYARFYERGRLLVRGRE
jgi:D-serine dehydratase